MVCVTTHKGACGLGKTVNVPHFNLACENRDTVEYASRERDESKHGIKTLLPFLKNVTDESNLEDFEDLMVGIRQFQ